MFSVARQRTRAARSTGAAPSGGGAAPTQRRKPPRRATGRAVSPRCAAWGCMGLLILVVGVWCFAGVVLLGGGPGGIRGLRRLSKRGVFPVHAAKTNATMEEIPHPALAFIDTRRIEALFPGKRFPETLGVPRFWQPSGSDLGERGGAGSGPIDVREFLGDSGKRLPTPREAAAIGSVLDGGLETIFVSLASYRDPECGPTLADLYARASHPERIRVGVVDQVAQPGKPNDTESCFSVLSRCGHHEDGDGDDSRILCDYKHLVDVYQVEAHLMVGPVLARHIAHRMYRGEYFAMQVDAHVRFTQGWDEDLVGQWKSTGNEMAVLSTYLSDIAGSIDPETHASTRDDRNFICHLNYEGTTRNRRYLIMKTPAGGPPRITGTPMLHPFWSAGFSFARGHFVVSVPYDQHLPMLFQGEEANIALRAWTHGYDFYTPERSVTFHIFAIKENADRKNRHKFWDYDLLYKGCLEKSMDRLVAITGMVPPEEISPDYYRFEEEKYGLGRVRETAQFFRLFGIRVKESAVVGQGRLCGFVKEWMHKEFSPHLRWNGMGIDYEKIDFEYDENMGFDKS